MDHQKQVDKIWQTTARRHRFLTMLWAGKFSLGAFAFCSVCALGMAPNAAQADTFAREAFGRPDPKGDGSLSQRMLEDEGQNSVGDPDVWHAEAALAEVDGDLDRAFKLLTRAHNADPSNASVLFDLARLTLELDRPPSDAVRRFLEADAQSADAALLQAYMLLRKGDLNNAGAKVSKVLAEDPDNVEALALQRLLKRESKPEKPAARVRVRASVAAQYDSNVRVLPEPTGSAAFRGLVDFSLVGQFVHGQSQSEAGLTFNYGPHLNERNTTSANDPQPLSFYDAAAVGVFYSFRAPMKRVNVQTFVGGTAVFLDSFNENFMQEGSAGAEALFVAGKMRLGPYVRGRYLAFDALNEEDSENDRDGAAVDGGLRLLAEPAKSVWMQLDAGWQSDFTQGTFFDQHGPMASFGVHYAQGLVRVDADLRYVGQYYTKVTATTRIDHQMQPSASVGIAATDFLVISAGYTLIRNISTFDNFDYLRHLAKVGVEGSW